MRVQKNRCLKKGTQRQGKTLSSKIAEIMIRKNAGWHRVHRPPYRPEVAGSREHGILLVRIDDGVCAEARQLPNRDWHPAH